MGLHKSALTHLFKVSRMRGGKWRAEAVSTTCDTVDRESWKEARDEIAQAVADAALNEADKTGVALARNENGGPIFATMPAMHKPDGTSISFEEQERAEVGEAKITHHQVTLFTAEAHELSGTDKTEEEDFAERAARIEPFPVPELDVIYFSVDAFAAEARGVIKQGLHLAARGISNDAMKRFSRWFDALLTQAGLNPQQEGAARWLRDRLWGVPLAATGSWQEKLMPQLAYQAAQVRCRTATPVKGRSGPKTSPRSMRMIAADVELRGEGKISAIARDHGISRQAVRDACNWAHSKTDPALAKKLEAERKRRKIEQCEQRKAVKAANPKSRVSN